MDGCKGNGDSRQPAAVQKLLVVSWPNAIDPLLDGLASRADSQLCRARLPGPLRQRVARGIQCGPLSGSSSS
jgi:hypothetical protein